jgi:alkylation response protein AidB-like acyl-CoA dehydrogenase
MKKAEFRKKEFHVDFCLTKEQRDIRRAAREFAQGEFDPDVALELERNSQFPLEIWRKACRLGFVGLHFPEQYGGQGLGLMENLLVVEEFCSHHSGIGIALSLSTYGSEMILRFGRNDQRKGYLARMTTGEFASSLAFLEGNPGKGISSFETKATGGSSGYLINGKKSFVLNGTLPGPMIVLCQLESNAKGGKRVALLLEKNRDRISCSSMGGRVGMRMVPISEVTFVNCNVSPASLLGIEGQGEFQLLGTLNEINLLAAAVGTGIAQGAFNLALAYARRREQFGRKIGSFEAIRDRIADMATQIEVSRSLTYKAAWDFGRDDGDQRLNYMAKMVSAENALEVSRESIHLFGGYGYMVEYKVEQFYRDASMIDMIGTVGGMEKGLIADHVIGRL